METFVALLVGAAAGLLLVLLAISDEYRKSWKVAYEYAAMRAETESDAGSAYSDMASVLAMSLGKHGRKTIVDQKWAGRTKHVG